MPVASYKVFQWGHPVGRGVMSSLYVAVSGVAKAATAAMPLTVANELTCADLARGIRLPVPPSFVVHNGEDKPYHVSLNFHLAGEDLPPADAAAIVADHPELAWGVVLFDAWICNDDRHAGNLAYDKPTKRLTLFDHSHSLFGRGKDRLEQAADKLAIGGHCLAAQMSSTTGLRRWHERIMALPDFYIREAVSDTIGEGTMTADLASFCGGFLRDRRPRLLELVEANAATFPKIPKEEWDALKGGGR